ncbi:nitrogen fixation protein NifQ [Ectothiorhodospira mobilis]|uniref:nitrogen fixation protein NifQ n=1 Tax=Ectothiorhodospira mobilis TaxID=195064 RepID=UPI001905C971|nr:nitrogen fixation protein NifQ [Ectothiorhodospira mobilis]MBK1690596.1 hypothetical protein [Ectothiorhodospira mobilis]
MQEGNPSPARAPLDALSSLEVRLCRAAGERPGGALLARIVAAQAMGLGVLPPDLELGAVQYRRLMEHYFPGIGVTPGSPSVPPDRPQERRDLYELMWAHRAGRDLCESWIAAIVARACLGGNHLWQDLGLAHREMLTRLMETHFPGLAERNEGDMKWKKFLYRQLCLAEGLRICRAPSCQVCPDYADCFGPET